MFKNILEKSNKKKEKNFAKLKFGLVVGLVALGLTGGISINDIDNFNIEAAEISEIDIGVFRVSNTTWYYDFESNGNTDKTKKWGFGTDLPVVGDFDGDGIIGDVGVFRSSSGTWCFDNDLDGDTDKTMGVWGTIGDLPVVGDFDRDGYSDDIAVFRGVDGKGYWYFNYDHIGHTNEGPILYGNVTDLPVAGDFDGDGFSDDIAVFRGTGDKGYWYFDYDHNGYTDEGPILYGKATDLPVAGDFDGDGFSDDIGVFRDGMWYLDYDHNGYTDNSIYYGDIGDLPLVGYFDEECAPKQPVCGDGKCEQGETPENCPQDCDHSIGTDTLGVKAHWNLSEIIGSYSHSHGIVPADVNKDGKADIIVNKGDWCQLYALTDVDPECDVIFEDDFETNFSKWNIIGDNGNSSYSISTKHKRSGSKSAKIISGGDNIGISIQRTFVPREGIVEVWYYDTMQTTTEQMLLAYGENYPVNGNEYVGVGVGNSPNYVVRHGENIVSSYYMEIPRTQGWHKFKILLDGYSASLYVDDIIIEVIRKKPEFKEVRLYTQNGIEPAYFDDFKMTDLSNAILWKTPIYSLHSPNYYGQNVMDIDNDGIEEAIVVADGIWVFDARNGNLKWKVDNIELRCGDNPSWQLCKLTDSSKYDIVVQTWLSPDIQAYSYNGEKLWETDIEDAWYGHTMTCADIDNDGLDEVMVPMGDGVGVGYDDSNKENLDEKISSANDTGDYKKSEAARGKTIAIDNDGTILWKSDIIEGYITHSDFAEVCDFNNDGKMEVFHDYSGGCGGEVVLLNGQDGTKIDGFSDYKSHSQMLQCGDIRPDLPGLEIVYVTRNGIVARDNNFDVLWEQDVSGLHLLTDLADWNGDGNLDIIASTCFREDPKTLESNVRLKSKTAELVFWDGYGNELLHKHFSYGDDKERYLMVQGTRQMEHTYDIDGDGFIEYAACFSDEDRSRRGVGKKYASDMPVHAYIFEPESVAIDHSPIGTLDRADQIQIAGWAYDEDAGINPIDVHIYIDGKMVGSATADILRLDLADAHTSLPNYNHGFIFETPTNLSVGEHTAQVYAINKPMGASSELSDSPMTFVVGDIGIYADTDGGSKQSQPELEQEIKFISEMTIVEIKNKIIEIQLTIIQLIKQLIELLPQQKIIIYR